MAEADVAATVDFLNACEMREPLGEGISLADYRAWLQHPATTSRVYLAVLGSAAMNRPIIGYIDATPPGADRRAWGYLLVHPDYRERGVGRALYRRFEQAVLPRHPAVLVFTPKQGAGGLQAFLERRGYEAERYYWDLRLPPDRVVPLPGFPPGVRVRTFVPGQDEPLLMHIRNTTFAEHYGLVPRTLDEIIYQTQQPHFRPDGVFFAIEDDECVGYCYANFNPTEIAQRGEAFGHIHNVGVLPGHRRRGLGRALLLTGVHYLRRHVPLVELNVEGQNTGALTLYESVGFRQHQARVNMVKRLNEPQA